MKTLIALGLTLLLINCAAMVIFYRILKSRFSPKRVLSDLRSEVDKLIVDLGREADRDVALLESRVKNLRSLIDEADRRILVADRETARKERERAVLSGQEEVRPPIQEERETPIAPQAKPANPPGDKKTESSDGRRSAVRDAAGTAIPRSPDEREPVTIYTRPVIRKSENPVEPVVPVRERVLDMARKGITAPMIAQTLSLPLGEVELILDMNSSSL
jgi:hypothetical protein